MYRRVDIKVGFACNNNCIFCAQAHKRATAYRPLEDLKKDLEESRVTCSGVVFTGGEVTIRKDLIELISYAKYLGYKSIQLQTNARMLSYMSLCKAVVEAGANEFSPALHGHIPELHDYLTQSKGAFEQTTQAIRNLRKLGQYILTNSVITKSNYRHLPELAKLLIALGVDQYQLAFPHAIGNAEKYFDKVIPIVSLAKPYIHKALQVGIDSGVKCMAEAMPYCQMEGYEKYISENYMPPGEIRDLNLSVDDWDSERKEKGKMKFPQCKKCKYDKVCEGPWHEYPEKRGSEEFQPVY